MTVSDSLGEFQRGFTHSRPEVEQVQSVHRDDASGLCRRCLGNAGQFQQPFIAAQTLQPADEHQDYIRFGGNSRLSRQWTIALELCNGIYTTAMSIMTWAPVFKPATLTAPAPRA